MTSEEPGQAEDKSQDNPEQLEDKSGKPFLTPAINTVLLIIVAAIAVYNILSIRELQNDNSGSELINSINENLESVAGELDVINARIREFDSDMSLLSASVEQSNESLEILYSNQGNREQRLSITEVEHLVKIAGIKVKLEGNTNAAIVALEEANSRLAEMGDPRLFSVRRQITRDINTLKSIPQVDVAGMSFTLSDLARRANQFSLKDNSIAGETQNPVQIEASEPAWKRLLLGVWQEFKSMFIITRTGEGISTSLLPNEKFFLYQNLRLQLESARLAVLRRDTELLQDSLARAESWLKEYFETNDAAVINTIEIISSMKTAELEQPLPDIDASLGAIKRYLEENQAANMPENVIE